MKLLIVNIDRTIATSEEFYLNNLVEQSDIVYGHPQALAAISSCRYDVIIIACSNLGLDICRTVRGLGIRTPIFMLSAVDNEDRCVDCLKDGADDFMCQPYNLQELSARLEALDRRANYRPLRSITAGNLKLDLATHSAQVNGRDLDIRPKEYELLACLMQNCGQAVSKTHLLNNVWGVSVGNSSTRLQVCIKTLREKLDDDTQVRIRNIRGFGYMLENEQANRVLVADRQ